MPIYDPYAAPQRVAGPQESTTGLAAMQMARALSNFGNTYVNDYVIPKDERDKKIAEEKATIAAQRYANFKAYSAAVKRGDVDPGDNPHLDLYTRSAFAQKHAQAVESRSVGIYQEEGVLSSPNPSEAIRTRLQEEADAYLKENGIDFSGDHHAQSAFYNELSVFNEQLTQRAGEKVRGYKIGKAVEAFGGRVAGLFDDASIEMISGEKDEQLIQIMNEESKLLVKEFGLPASEVNGMLVDVILERVQMEGIGEDGRGSGQMLALDYLDTLHDVETAPGFKLGNVKGVAKKIQEARGAINYAVYTNDKAYEAEQQKIAKQKREEQDSIRREIAKAQAEGGPEAEAVVEELIEKYPGYSTMIRQEYVRGQQAISAYEIAQDAEAAAEITQAIMTGEADRAQIESAIDTLKVDPRTKANWHAALVGKQMKSAQIMKLHEPMIQDAFMAKFAIPDPSDPYGMSEKFVMSREGQMKLNELRPVLHDALMELEATEEFAQASSTERYRMVGELVESQLSLIRPPQGDPRLVGGSATSHTPPGISPVSQTSGDPQAPQAASEGSGGQAEAPKNHEGYFTAWRGVQFADPKKRESVFQVGDVPAYESAMNAVWILNRYSEEEKGRTYMEGKNPLTSKMVTAGDWAGRRIETIKTVEIPAMEREVTKRMGALRLKMLKVAQLPDLPEDASWSERITDEAKRDMRGFETELRKAGQEYGDILAIVGMSLDEALEVPERLRKFIRLEATPFFSSEEELQDLMDQGDARIDYLMDFYGIDPATKGEFLLHQIRLIRHRKGQSDITQHNQEVENAATAVAQLQ